MKKNKINKPKVAVVLPVHNVIKYLPDMIDALYNSTDFPFKLIIIDGFSDDGTKEYCETLVDNKENVELYLVPKKGLVNAINFGIQKAGELDVYLTQPDVIHVKLYKQDWLEGFCAISKQKNIGLLTGVGGWGISGPNCINGFYWFGTWNTYISRKVINKIGLFDEQFLGMDDVDYSYRSALAGFNNTVIERYWVDHHQLTDRLDGNDSDNLEKMAKLFRKKWKLGEYKIQK